jgi:hypothetical protein
VLAVVQEKDSAGPLLGDERYERRVGLGRVARLAGDDQVIGAVVGCLTLAGVDVVEGGAFLGDLRPAIGADRTILVDQPATMGIHRAAAETAVSGRRGRRRTTTICS